MAGFSVNSERCYACKTCSIGCANEKMLPAGVLLRRVRTFDTATGIAMVSMACNHCDEPACLAVCPQSCYTKDEATGLVIQNHDLCIGCKSCVMACPFGAVSVATTQVPVLMGDVRVGSQTKSFVLKCDLCVDRPGGPACAEACPTKGLTLVDEERLAELTAERARATIENEA